METLHALSWPTSRHSGLRVVRFQGDLQTRSVVLLLHLSSLESFGHAWQEGALHLGHDTAVLTPSLNKPRWVGPKERPP
jgi:hypothetical protein